MAAVICSHWMASGYQGIRPGQYHSITGILRPDASGDRAWCRVVEFAEEFGISVSYDPLVLGARRGG